MDVSKKHSAQRDAERKGPNSTSSRSANLPRPANRPGLFPISRCYYLPATDEVIPADMATPSPDDRFHRCAYNPVVNEFDPGPFWKIALKTRCFFAPMNSS
jgi:hypothetical protein